MKYGLAAALLVVPFWIAAGSSAEAQNWSNFSTPNESFADEPYDANVYDDNRQQTANTRYSGYTPRHNQLNAPWFGESPTDSDWTVGGAYRTGNYWKTADFAEPVTRYRFPLHERSTIRVHTNYVYPTPLYDPPIYSPPAPYPLHPPVDMDLDID